MIIMPTGFLFVYHVSLYHTSLNLGSRPCFLIGQPRPYPLVSWPPSAVLEYLTNCITPIHNFIASLCQTVMAIYVGRSRMIQMILLQLRTMVVKGSVFLWPAGPVGRASLVYVEFLWRIRFDRGP